VTHAVFGIRHHGPGSARSIERALDELEPDAVLIEGPPEGDALLELAEHEEMQPPVALLAYAPDEPRKAAFYPMARFSPEWRAIRHALRRGVPVRLIDLPAAVRLAEEDGRPSAVRADPLAALAEAAGHGDAERWWEDVVEARRDGLGAFEAIADAMAALRETFPAEGREAEVEARREAHMRQAIRAALRDGAERVAVVCGAWHAPALATLGPAAPDARLLRGLPRVKVAATWVPWTYELLARESGYGAGVDSPAWYEQLHDEPGDPVSRWLSGAARLMREAGTDASAAQVVDAARLAGALAAVRDRPLPGLPELLDAARAVLAGGSDVPLALVRRRLVVGEVLGRVPSSTPMVPLHQDLERRRRRLRLKLEASARDLELDLRREIDRERSRLLHRLVLLGVDWGVPVEVRGARGTFREAWRLEWRPGLEIDLIEAGRWGTTVDGAAMARVRQAARDEDDLAALATFADAVLLADLPDALGEVLAALEARAAVGADAAALLGAVPALAGVLRYGDVRGSDRGAVGHVLVGIMRRATISLPQAGIGLDDEAAGELAGLIDGANGALALLEDESVTADWRAALRRIADGDRQPGALAGRATRLLLDAGAIETDAVAAAMSRALSAGGDPVFGAAWIEGFLRGSGLVLVHDATLLGLLDDWVNGVIVDAFEVVLPLLRRTFGALPAGERRRIGTRVRAGAPAPAEEAAASAGYDAGRAAPALAVVARILGGATKAEAS
jgi:Family of unknown function (DUF5682)